MPYKLQHKWIAIKDCNIEIPVEELVRMFDKHEDMTEKRLSDIEKDIKLIKKALQRIGVVVYG